MGPDFRTEVVEKFQSYSTQLEGLRVESVSIIHFINYNRVVKMLNIFVEIQYLSYQLSWIFINQRQSHYTI